VVVEIQLLDLVRAEEAKGVLVPLHGYYTTKPLQLKGGQLISRKL